MEFDLIFYIHRLYSREELIEAILEPIYINSDLSYDELLKVYDRCLLKAKNIASNYPCTEDMYPYLEIPVSTGIWEVETTESKEADFDSIKNDKGMLIFCFHRVFDKIEKKFIWQIKESE